MKISREVKASRLNLSVECLDQLHLPLVNKFYKACRYSAKAGRNDVVFVVRLLEEPTQQPIIAAVRLQLQQLNNALVGASPSYFLRSMCVAPTYRKKGVGLFLLQELRPFLQDCSCYCYPFSHLESFYGSIGFALKDPSLAPSYMTEAFLRYRRQGRDIILMSRD